MADPDKIIARTEDLLSSRPSDLSSSDRPDALKSPAADSSGTPIGPQAGSVSRRTQQFSAELYSGPTFHPDLLAKFEQVVPGSAERLLAIYEREQAQAQRQTEHRISLESKVIGSDIYRSWAGLLAGFVLAAIGLYYGHDLSKSGHDWAGVAMVGVPLVSLASAFIYATNSRREERQKKAEIVMGRKPAERSEPPELPAKDRD